VSKSKRELSGEEKRLWRRVAASIKGHSKVAVTPPTAPRGGPSLSQPRRFAGAPADPTPYRTKAKVRCLSPPPERGGEKRVRRGKLEIGATLDLHGHTQITGRSALERFLRAAQARGELAVVVVTGVGRAGEGVLKRRLPEWLAEPALRPLTSGYAQAHRSHGGVGAYYVFLKRR